VLKMNELLKNWKEVPLKDVLDYEQPNNYIISKPLKNDKNLTPVLTPNKAFIKGYTNEKTGIYKSVPVIIFDDFTTDNKFVNFPFKVKSSAMKILKLKDKDVHLKYVFYQMQLKTINHSTHKRYYISKYQNIRFIFPINKDNKIDFQTQKTIVDEIEKQFTRLDASVKAFKEVKKKLDVYRKSVLKAAFEGKYVKSFKYKLKKLGDFERKGGGTPSTKVKEYWGGKINWITSANIDNKNRIHFEKKITDLGLKNSVANLIPKGSVIVVTRVGLGKVAVNEEDTAFSQDSQGIICKDVNPYFLMWQIKNSANEIKSKGQGTTINGITVNKLNNIKLKIPNTPTQEQIVQEIESRFSVIDKLEETVDNSLRRAELLRKSILKSAFEGKLVKGDNND